MGVRNRILTLRFKYSNDLPDFYKGCSRQKDKSDTNKGETIPERADLNTADVSADVKFTSSTKDCINCSPKNLYKAMSIDETGNSLQMHVFLEIVA